MSSVTVTLLLILCRHFNYLDSIQQHLAFVWKGLILIIGQHIPLIYFVCLGVGLAMLFISTWRRESSSWLMSGVAWSGLFRRLILFRSKYRHFYFTSGLVLSIWLCQQFEEPMGRYLMDWVTFVTGNTSRLWCVA